MERGREWSCRTGAIIEQHSSTMAKTTAVKKVKTTKRALSKKRTGKAAVSGKLSTKAVHGIAQLRAPQAQGGSMKANKVKEIITDLDISMPIWSNALHMSAATLKKRIEKRNVFDALEADRLYTVQQVLKRGMEVFEDTDDLEAWLKEKHAILGNERPMDLLGSTWGIGQVMLELGRIEHGVH